MLTLEIIMLGAKKRERLVAVFLGLAFSLTGCNRMRTAEVNHPSHTSADNATTARFQEPETSHATLIESAVELSDKYAQLSKKNTELQQLNQGLQQENAQLKDNIQSWKTQLKQGEAQLDESNRLVMDLNGELQVWKKDILGFRSEMRSAATAQINALMKIMNAMGVEASSEPPVPVENSDGQTGPR
jgi:septal ring factor EnvC (AmiA/AmiB activator)